MKRALIPLSLLLSLVFTGCTETTKTRTVGPTGTTGGGTTQGGGGGGILPPPGVDSDEDGLDDRDEIQGWLIAVDSVGFGPGSLSSVLVPFLVTSDPNDPDTDGDGLGDKTEFLTKTHPRKSDSDGDGLSDADELQIWGTSPVSVDSDSDARGPDPLAPLPPKSDLFDGQELFVLGTSPSLADTDGDNRTDYEEHNNSLRDPRIAELPKIGVDFEGEIDIRLSVEYAESEGIATKYGSLYSTTQGSSTSSTSSTSVAVKKEADKGGFGFLEDIAGGVSSGGLKGAAMVVGKQVAEVGHSAYCDEISSGNNPAASAIGVFYPGGGKAVQNSADWLNSAIKLEDAKNYATGQLGVCAPATPETTTTTTNSLTKESSQSATQEYSKYTTESRNKTEVVSTGSVTVGARVSNLGIYAWDLSDLYITMLQWQANPGSNAGIDGIGTGTFRTLATLTPKAVANVVLGPGASSPIIELEDTGVNAAIIKQFLRRPDAIFYEPAGFELSNVEGINYQFLTENTYGQTATVVLDFGGGQAERYQVATNVARYLEDDPNGAFMKGDLAGVSMGSVMATIGVPYTVVLAPRVIDAQGTEANILVLDTVRGIGNDYGVDIAAVPQRALSSNYKPDGIHTGPALGSPTSFWTISTTLDEDKVRGVDFNRLSLKLRDTIRIMYVEDADGDGVYADEEAAHGSVDSADDFFINGTWLPGSDGIPDSVDTDHDGLTDFMELKLGWRVAIDLDTDLPGTFVPHELLVPAGTADAYYWIYSDPTTADGDGDGLTDEEEFVLFLDPNNADTDADGATDITDAYPNTPARRLHVDLNGPTVGADGSTWALAYPNLQVALNMAGVLNFDSIPHNDITEIWVAEGVYTPGTHPSSAFILTPGVAVLGGFVGDETKSSQRDSNPLTTGTILSGDLLGDDDSNIGGPAYSDNAVNVVRGTNGAVLDSLVISSASGVGLRVNDIMTVRNCLFRFNSGVGALIPRFGFGPAPTPLQFRFEGCVFSGNKFVNPYFSSTSSGKVEHGAGIVALNTHEEVVLDRCTFFSNEGSSVILANEVVNPAAPSGTGHLTVESCLFNGNIITDGLAPLPTMNGAQGDTNCAIIAIGGASGYSFSIDNSVFTNNQVTSRKSGGREAIPSIIFFTDKTSQSPSRVSTISNTLIADNTLTIQYASAGFTTGNEFAAFCVYGLGQVCEVVNSTFIRNHATRATGGNLLASGSLRTWFTDAKGRSGLLQNVISYGQTASFYHPTLPLQGLLVWSSTVHNSCIGETVNSQNAVGVISTDPAIAGNSLSSGSPCIDTGSIFVDFDPNTPGFQGPPALDLAGQARIQDGDGNGFSEIDMGAYEFPSASGL